ncbi:hypothetical protein RI054_44g153380 [Pseudoscourfieldia marina]
MSWPYYSRTARAAQIRPIVLKTVAIIYNNMTHGATDKIPSIELFRSADDLSALRIIGDLIYVYIPKRLRNAMRRMGSKYMIETIYMKPPHGRSATMKMETN